MNLDIFSQKIFNKGALGSDMWGFVDGTVRGTCREEARTTFRSNQFVVAIRGNILSSFKPLLHICLVHQQNLSQVKDC